VCPFKEKTNLVDLQFLFFPGDAAGNHYGEFFDKIPLVLERFKQLSKLLAM
jgi:hypothetical protein